jgi:hypothetical protein
MTVDGGRTQLPPSSVCHRPSYLEEQHMDNSPVVTPAPPAPATAEFLHQIPLFAGLDDYALERLIAMSTQVQLQTGDVLIRENDMGDSMYIVLDGTLQVRKQARDTEVVLARCRCSTKLRAQLPSSHSRRRVFCK